MVSRSVFEELAARAIQQRDHLATEEATKHALVLPFIQALGYDVFNPLEVVPEFVADYGLKVGEKVDYAVMRDGKPAIVIECKRVDDPLDVARASQLARYFTHTPAGIAILTNGIVYKFFSDLDASNTMDTTPFYEFDLTTADSSRVRQNLDQFAKSTFDPDRIRSVASNMKHISGMKTYLSTLYNQPDGEFVRLLARKVYGGSLFQSRIDHFTGLTKLAFQGFVNDRINERLQRAASEAMTGEEPVDAEPLENQSAPQFDPQGVVTTAEELEAFEVVKVILAPHMDVDRLVFVDTINYAAVRIGDKRQWMCRFRFHSPDPAKRYIEIRGGNTARRPIVIPEDIRQYADDLIEAARLMLE